MKGLIISSLALFAMAACTTDEVTIAKLGDNFDLKVNQSVSFTDNSSTIDTKLVTIADSRCPQDVQCVRAGEAIVTLNVQVGQEKFEGVKVCIQCEKAMGITETAEVKAKNRTYKINLKAVNPYPKAGSTPEQTATLVIN